MRAKGITTVESHSIVRGNAKLQFLTITFVVNAFLFEQSVHLKIPPFDQHLVNSESELSWFYSTPKGRRQ